VLLALEAHCTIHGKSTHTHTHTHTADIAHTLSLLGACRDQELIRVAGETGDDVASVCRLLEQGAGLTANNKWGHTALMAYVSPSLIDTTSSCHSPHAYMET
jgi:hypothetical protein